MNFDGFIGWIAQGLLAGSIWYLANQMMHFRDGLVEVGKALAGAAEKLTWHEKTLDKHTEEIEDIKGLCARCPLNVK